MTCTVFGFPDEGTGSAQLATELGVAHHTVAVRRFPDGESLVRVEQSPATVLLYRSLNDPNAKLVELLLTASALRANGANRVTLVAPYLCYMRQDAAFHPGEAISQEVIGRLIADHFDGLVTIDPHLHRVASLSDILPGIDVINVSSAPLLASAIGIGGNPVLVAPDEEAEQWVGQVAQAAGLDYILGHKERRGDRRVFLTLPQVERIRERPAVIIDDIISSGTTIREAVRQLIACDAGPIDVLATHCLAGEAELADLRRAGIRSIRATDTVPRPVADLSTAALVADQIRRHGWI